MSTTPDQPASGPRRGALLVIFLVVFIDLIGFGIVLPLLPLYADQFTVDESGWIIGALMASFSLMQFLFAPIWGAASDRWGRRPIILIGLASSCFFYSLFAWASLQNSLVGLFIARIGAGIAGATIPTAQAYIADTTTAENRTRGMALIGMAFGLGFTLGPVFAYAALVGGGQSLGAGPGLLAAGLSLTAWVLAIWKLPESNRFRQSAVALDVAPQSRHAGWWRGDAWRAALGSRALRYLILGFFVVILCFALFETSFSMLLRGSEHSQYNPFQFDLPQICLVFAGIGLLSALIQGGVVRPLSKKISNRTLAISGALIEVVGFASLSWAVQSQKLAAVFSALFVIVIGYACLQPSLYALLSRWSDPKTQGAALGVGQSASAMGRILGALFSIPLIRIAAYVPALVSAAAMAIALVAILLACRYGRDYQET